MISQLLKVIVEQVLQLEVIRDKLLADSAKQWAGKGKTFVKRSALKAVGFALLMIAFVTMVIDLGQQWERGLWSFSGLMFSSSLFVAIAVVFLVIGFFPESSKSAEAQSPKEPVRSPLQQAIENLLTRYLNQLSASMDQPSNKEVEKR